MLEINKIHHGDCLELMREIPDKSIDLIVTDPPYEIKNTVAGGNSKLAKSIQKMNDQITQDDIVSGFDFNILDQLYRVMKKPNIYIWCNCIQIPMYIDFFVKNKNCKFDILIWNKTNATPLFNNKYLTDKEFCLYFRNGGKCSPKTYEMAKTVFNHPINAEDKKMFGHPTIKPLPIIKNLILNSSDKCELILDPFCGSGTTPYACLQEDRNFIGIEINKKYVDIANERISEYQQKLF